MSAILLIGCASIAPVNESREPDQQSVTALQAEVTQLAGELADLQHTLAAVRSEQQAVTAELDLQNRALGRVETAVTALPETLKQSCPPPRPAETACKEPQVQRVVVSGNKMVVGELEQVWLDPPAMAFTARIETSAANNALRADAIVEFERDGKAWARFALHPPGSAQRIEVERRVVSHLRTVQAGDGEGVKRPVVKMQLKLGDVEDTFSFALTERGDAAYQVLLGRAFLKDIAIVDVGARYIQPRVDAKRAAKAKPAEKTTQPAPPAQTPPPPAENPPPPQ
jgi:outer membrane murein-binding lipoprotein Lpp